MVAASRDSGLNADGNARGPAFRRRPADHKPAAGEPAKAGTTSAVEVPLSNELVAQRLDEVAELLDGRVANPFRVRAYRRAADTLRALDRPVSEILASEGQEALCELPGIGEAIARAIEKLTLTDELSLLSRLRGRSGAEAVLATLPGIGRKTAARIRIELGIESLHELEIAAYDGRLAALTGMGRKRIRAVRESLAARLRTRPRQPPAIPVLPFDAPDVAELLSIDQEFRRKAQAKRLLQVAPARFNPSGQAWLPILRARRGPRRYRALSSNTPLAHELGTTDDWVVIYLEGRGQSGQWTVVTARVGHLKGRRVVRGREADCTEFYESRKTQAALFSE